jgi:serine/threonine-protein kinase
MDAVLRLMTELAAGTPVITRSLRPWDGILTSMALGLNDDTKRTVVKLLAALALVATVLGGFAACLFTVRSNDEAANPVPSGPALEGSFKVDIGPTATPDGKPVAGSARTETWVARSNCRDTECVATVAVLNPTDPSGPPQLTMVFDYIDGDWLTVREAPDKCKVGDAEVDVTGWSVISLRPKLDGSLSGEYTWATAPALCASKRAVNLTPTRGSGTAGQAIDPALEPALRTSPGAALRGTYTYTQTYPETGEVFPPHDYRATTHCLRTGERCVTLMSTVDTNNLFVMLYGGGHFTATFPEGNAQCTDGVGKVRQTSRDDLPLPQGPQDPIIMLTGKSFQEYTGDCPAKIELDVRLQRTGE